jgi:hypothetical protein
LAHSYCQALAAKLLVAEELSSLEAMAYVQSPRPGRGESPFIRVWVPDQQTNKRPRLNLPQLNFAGPIGDTQGINAYKKYKNARICRENIEFFNKKGFAAGKHATARIFSRQSIKIFAHRLLKIGFYRE